MAVKSVLIKTMFMQVQRNVNGYPCGKIFTVREAFGCDIFWKSLKAGYRGQLGNVFRYNYAGCSYVRLYGKTRRGQTLYIKIQ